MRHDLTRENAMKQAAPLNRVPAIIDDNRLDDSTLTFRAVRPGRARIVPRVVLC
jgi:hypothetical protein